MSTVLGTYVHLQCGAGVVDRYTMAGSSTSVVLTNLGLVGEVLTNIPCCGWHSNKSHHALSHRCGHVGNNFTPNQTPLQPCIWPMYMTRPPFFSCTRTLSPTLIPLCESSGGVGALCNFHCPRGDTHGIRQVPNDLSQPIHHNATGSRGMSEPLYHDDIIHLRYSCRCKTREIIF